MRKRLTKKELKKIKELDLLSYFQNYEPDELIKNGRNDFKIRSYDSFHISNGLWCWWAKGMGGRSALDYFIKVKGWNFMDAAWYLKELIDKKQPVHARQEIRKYDRLILPKKNEDNLKVIDYLVKERCIDRQIVDYCIQHFLLYECAKDHSAVFIGYDHDQIPRYACKRATNAEWKMDVAGSDKRYSFSITNKKSPSLHLFESAIDLLSYMTLLKRHNIDYLSGNYLSISGATLIGKSIETSAIPIALENFIANHQEIEQLFLHLDNDQAGKQTTQKIIFHLEDRYDIYDEPPPAKYKDYNEYLINKTKNKEIVI